MSQPPTILTQQELTQRSAKPVCLIQSEEILRVRTPAYAKSNSDLSFLIRQPSSSAIMVNDVQLDIAIRFKLDTETKAKGRFVKNTYRQNDDLGDYGYMPQMLPWLAPASSPFQRH